MVRIRPSKHERMNTSLASTTLNGCFGKCERPEGWMGVCRPRVSGRPEAAVQPSFA
jgi:hypothetical protein